MDDPQTKNNTSEDGRATRASVTRRVRQRWPWVLFGVVVLLPTLLLAMWTAATLNWSYSRGERAGFIQKISQKGWLCKTWEGEIAMVNVPGAAQERFAFTVRDDSVAAKITKFMGYRVVLAYAQHKGVPGTCFGETEYFVTGVQTVP